MRPCRGSTGASPSVPGRPRLPGPDAPRPDGGRRAGRQHRALAGVAAALDADPRLDPRAVPGSAADGWRELVRRWLTAFGPGTEDDVVWWQGATKGIVRAALGELDTVPYTSTAGPTGWLLPDDLRRRPRPGPWVALLPVLDPTVWAGRRGGSTSDRTASTSSTATATPARRCGSTAGSSAAGCRTPRRGAPAPAGAGSRPGPARPWRPRPAGSRSGWWHQGRDGLPVAGDEGPVVL